MLTNVSAEVDNTTASYDNVTVNVTMDGTPGNDTDTSGPSLGRTGGIALATVMILLVLLIIVLRIELVPLLATCLPIVPRMLLLRLKCC